MSRWLGGDQLRIEERTRSCLKITNSTCCEMAAAPLKEAVCGENLDMG